MRPMTLMAGLLLLGVAAPAAQMLQPGDAFPAWSLVDQSGVPVTSQELAGKTYLLWFYPKAMTPGCTAEGKGLRDNFPELQAAGVVVLGVSFDAPKDNAAFVREYQFPFRLLSDRERALAVAVGAADSREQAVARRISYLVGPDGKVRHAYDAVNPATHAEQVLRDAAAAAPKP